jgi:hypothetical protein
MNRNILLGCAVVFVALVAALVVAAFVLVPRTVSKAEKVGRRANGGGEPARCHRESLAASSAALDAGWFPAAVGAWTLTANERRRVCRVEC